MRLNAKRWLKLDRRLRNLERILVRTRLEQILQLLANPRRMLLMNFLSGIAKGVGVAIGFTILGAILIIILQSLAVLNIPVIGNFIAEIVRIVNSELK